MGKRQTFDCNYTYILPNNPAYMRIEDSNSIIKDPSLNLLDQAILKASFAILQSYVLVAHSQTDAHHRQKDY